MKCSRCCSENSIDAKYCKECAEPLIFLDSAKSNSPIGNPIRCKWCEASNCPEERYCWKCNAPLLAGLPFMMDGQQVGNFKVWDKLNERYFLCTILGVGGWSNVYGAIDMTTSRHVAIKELDHARIKNDKDREIAVKGFLSEKSTLQSLDHQNIPHYVDFFVYSQKRYLVMEFVDGKTLEEIMLLNIVLGENQVLTYAKQICDVLNYLHKEKQLLFCDVTPANIMVEDFPKGNIVKLIDFGIARKMAGGRVPRMERFGTAGYAAPEQREGRPTEKSDIYSLAVIMYVLIAHVNKPEIYDSKFPRLRELAPTVSQNTEEIIMKGLSYESEQRWTAKEMFTQITAAQSKVKNSKSGRERVKTVPESKGMKNVTYRLSQYFAKFSNGQLTVAFLVVVSVMGTLTWLLAPIFGYQTDIDIQIPVLATFAALMFAATARPDLAAATFFVVHLTVAFTIRLSLKVLDSSFGVVILAALLVSLFVYFWLGYLPKFAENDDTGNREIIWLALMGSISTMLFFALTKGVGIILLPTIWFGGAIDGVIGWFLGDTVRKFFIARGADTSR